MVNFFPLNSNSDEPASCLLRNSTPWLHPAIRCVCHECEYDFNLLFAETFIPVQVLTLFKMVLLLLIVVTGRAPRFLG